MKNQNIRINGIDETLEARTLLDVLAAKGFDAAARGIAVALNARVVPRTAWPHTLVNAQDDIEIIHARQGG
jgi:sulfur carrier protein